MWKVTILEKIFESSPLFTEVKDNLPVFTILYSSVEIIWDKQENSFFYILIRDELMSWPTIFPTGFKFDKFRSQSNIANFFLVSLELLHEARSISPVVCKCTYFVHHSFNSSTAQSLHFFVQYRMSRVASRQNAVLGGHIAEGNATARRTVEASTSSYCHSEQ